MSFYVCPKIWDISFLYPNKHKYMTPNPNIKEMNDFVTFMQQQIQEKRACNKVKTSVNYHSALRSFNRFLEAKGHSTRIPFELLTDELVTDYEAYLLQERGITKNSSSFYLRALHAVYKRGVDSFRLRLPDPFSHAYTGVDKTDKRAVNLDIIVKLMKCNVIDTRLEFCRDLFVFSFFARGIAFIDLVKLKKGNLVNGRLIYHRSKTGHLLSVKVEKNMLAIINKYTRKEDDYLFPILKTDTFTPKAYWSALRMYNLHLKELSAKAGIHVKLTSYVARHSWATEAMRQHVPLRVISESMGHSNEKTTSIYLSSLDNREVDKATRKILDAVRKKIKGEKAGNEKDKKQPTNSYSINSVISFYYTSTQEVDNFDANVDKILKPTK